MKGVILAGGFGSRLKPATLVTNKHLLPVYENDGAIPMIFYPINTLKSMGINDILIITSREHCGHMVEVLGDGYDYDCSFTYKIQEMNRKPTGIAQALKLSKDFITDDFFAVILGDNFYEKFNFLKNNIQKAKIFLKSVDDPERFGVATINEDKIIEIKEKPKIPKSNLAVTGLYIYPIEVFNFLHLLKPSSRGELEITDLNNYFIKNNYMDFQILDTFWSDMGTIQGMKQVQKFLTNKKAIN